MKFKPITNVFLALTVAVLFPAVAFAQDQMVKLSGEKITLAEAFDQIEQQTDLSIDYDAASIDAGIIVSVPQERGRVSYILGRLLEGTGYIYSFNRSHVIISVQKPVEQEPADHTVTGEVRDMDGQPVIGASVMLAGTSAGTVTDLDGKFSIQAPEDGILRFSSIGYRSVDISLNGRAVLSVTMPEDNLYLDEVVVVGYGTQKKVNLTGAVDQISSDAFAGRPTANMTQMLQGAVPNLNINFTDGRPNGSPGYNIRGTTSIGQGGDLPLFQLEGDVVVRPDPRELLGDMQHFNDVFRQFLFRCAYRNSRCSHGWVYVCRAFLHCLVQQEMVQSFRNQQDNGILHRLAQRIPRQGGHRELRDSGQRWKYGYRRTLGLFHRRDGLL